MPTILVIEHVPHERLGNLETPLRAAGCALRSLRAWDAKAAWPPVKDVDAIVSMGGPQSVYQQKQYPYLTRELTLMREPGADGDPMWEPFGQTETVFQWHGDTYSLPKGAVQLARSPLCEQQAFRFGKNIYALQFHLEVTEVIVRAWMMNSGNRKELAALKGKIDPLTIRRQSPQHVARIKELCDYIARTFAEFIE